MLSNLGRREDALAASQEAVDIYRRLAELRPDAFLPNLATSLNNTGAMLSNLGRREDALAASQEAVDIYRRLAELRPDAFLPNLATSLNNTGAMLSNLGRREDALAASQEAVDIYRRLAELRPERIPPQSRKKSRDTGADAGGGRSPRGSRGGRAVKGWQPSNHLRPGTWMPSEGWRARWGGITWRRARGPASNRTRNCSAGSHGRWAPATLDVSWRSRRLSASSAPSWRRLKQPAAQRGILVDLVRPISGSGCGRPGPVAKRHPRRVGKGVLSAGRTGHGVRTAFAPAVRRPNTICVPAPRALSMRPPRTGGARPQRHDT